MGEALSRPVVTQGHLLGGLVRYDQFAAGHRTGIEPVLLAAAVPARAGQRVLEAGTGAGAALLCLAHRVPGIVGVGVEIDAALAGLAAANFLANGFDGLSAVAADIETLQGPTLFDHAMANPPWHAPAGTASPDRARESARRGEPGLVSRWTNALAARLRTRGTLTLIMATSMLPEWLAALPPATCGSPTVLPLWPREGAPAKLVVVQAVRGGAGPMRLLAGWALHTAEGDYTPEVSGILWPRG